MDENIKSSLQGMTVEEQLAFYKDYYDTVIRFDDYYYKMFPDWDGVFNTKCRLHDEVNGESCGYSEEMNLCSCWGACHIQTRVVYYHYLYTKKTDENVTMLQTLRAIYDMFTSNPTDRRNRRVEAYANLPYPELLRSSVDLSVGTNMSVKPKQGKQLNPALLKQDIISTKGTLSCKILNKYLTEKDKSKSYK